MRESEDAVQEALLAAAGRWPVDGVPANPIGWLITAVSRRLVETSRKAGRSAEITSNTRASRTE